MVALAGEGEVTGFEDEPEVGVQRGTKRIEDGARHLDDATARLADEVLVGVLGEVVHGGAVTQVDVIDDPELLEVVEEAVDGGLVDVGVAGVHRGRQLLGRRVAIVVEQRLHDGPAGRRHPPAASADQVQHLIELRCLRHRAECRRENGVTPPQVG